MTSSHINSVLYRLHISLMSKKRVNKISNNKWVLFLWTDPYLSYSATVNIFHVSSIECAKVNALGKVD